MTLQPLGVLCEVLLTLPKIFPLFWITSADIEG